MSREPDLQGRASVGRRSGPVQRAVGYLVLSLIGVTMAILINLCTPEEDLPEETEQK